MDEYDIRTIGLRNYARLLPRKVVIVLKKAAAVCIRIIIVALIYEALMLVFNF